MLKKIFISICCLFFSIISINAQTKSLNNKIKLGTKSYSLKGSVFNEIVYLPPEKSKDVFYHFWDKKNKTLTIAIVGYELENGKSNVSTLETFVCPFNKIDKDKSYILEMENEAITDQKVYRLTLISKGQGADNLYFQRRSASIFTDEIQIIQVNNVSIFFKSKAEAEKWLKNFTK